MCNSISAFPDDDMDGTGDEEVDESDCDGQEDRDADEGDEGDLLFLHLNLVIFVLKDPERIQMSGNTFPFVLMQIE
jgi:hypothetical protein